MIFKRRSKQSRVESISKSGKNSELQAALKEQQRVSQMLIQKDLELSLTNAQLDRQVDQLQVLQSVVNKIRVINDQSKVLKIIAEALVVDLHFATVIVLLGTPPFDVAVNYSYRQVDLDALKRTPLILDAYANTACLVKDADKGSSAEQKLGKVLQLTSYCVLPLQLRRKCYGLFICGLDDPYQKMSDLDIEFIELTANTIATILESLAVEERQLHIDALKSEFISIASHQLRTPLSAVKWTLKMLLDGDLGKVTSEQGMFLEKAYKSNERMIELVNDLLDVSRIEDGRVDYKMMKFNFVSFLKEILDQNNVLLEKKQLKLKTNIGEKKEIVVLGDPDRLSLAFNNLIDNAIKFTPNKKEIEIKVTQDQDSVLIVIKDQGIGIDKKDQEQLFSKFFRSQSAKKMQTKGTGLGLFIAKNIIIKHHGEIKIDSVLGKGTTVTCRLPREHVLKV